MHSKEQIFLNQFQVPQKYEKKINYLTAIASSVCPYLLFTSVYLYLRLILLASFYGYFYTHKFYIIVQKWNRNHPTCSPF